MDGKLEHPNEAIQQKAHKAQVKYSISVVRDTWSSIIHGFPHVRFSSWPSTSLGWINKDGLGRAVGSLRPARTVPSWST